MSLQEQMTKKGVIGINNPNYSYEVFDSSDLKDRLKDKSKKTKSRGSIWRHVHRKARAYINIKGGEHGHLVTSYNKSRGDLACVSVLSWDMNVAE